MIYATSMECWNIGILDKSETNHFNCRKILQTHYSITPSFHYSNWGETLRLFLGPAKVPAPYYICVPPHLNPNEVPVRLPVEPYAQAHFR
jgi:hypothetical protein